MTLIRFYVLFVLAAFIVNGAAPEPVFRESFDSGKLDGPVGKAGDRLRLDGMGVVNMERGTIAFFYQSKEAPTEREWGGMGGIRANRDSGYWSMGPSWQTRKQAFMFNFYDVSGFAPPLRYASIFGRWQAGEWHHLAVVWDRAQGMTAYEDGKRVDSDWGERTWNWNVLPEEFSLAGPLDEVMIYDECLTDAQIAQLADGAAPTGDPLPLLALAERRAYELARLGWSEPGRLPQIESGDGIRLLFAPVRRCMDAKRPVEYPWGGLLRSAWPSHKYGASIRGQQLEIELHEASTFDRLRLFVHRSFEGRLLLEDEAVLAIEAPEQAFWHGELEEAVTTRSLVLERQFGQLGQFDLYRVEDLGLLDRFGGDWETFYLVGTEAYPDNAQGRLLSGETPRRLQAPVLATRAKTDDALLTTPAFGGFQVVCEAPTEANAYRGVRVELVVEGLTEPTPVRVEVKEPVTPERVWLAGDAVLAPDGSKRQRFTLEMTGRPVINMPPWHKKKYLKDGKYADELLPMPGVSFTMTVTAGAGLTWVLGDDGTRFRFQRVEQEAVLAVAVEDQVEFMREAYAETMEGHGYSWDRLQRPMIWLARFAPERMEFRQMWNRVDHQKPNIPELMVPPFEFPQPANPLEAPQWALWQHYVMDLHREHLHWIIDNKQVWTGEFGGVWNDDSTHIENWMGYMLCLDDSRKIYGAMQDYWDGLYTRHLWEGVGRYTQDTGHYSEEGASNLGMRLLIDYGDPQAHTRALRATSHYPKWFVKGDDGQWLFRSWYVGPMGAWTEGAFERNAPMVSHGLDIVVSMAYLTWYNRYPPIADFLSGLKPTGHGLLGPAYDRITDFEAAKARYAEQGAAAIGRRGPGPQIEAIQELGLTEEIAKAHAMAYKQQGTIGHYWGSKDTDKHWFFWKVSGDIRYLEDSYQRVAEWFHSHDWLNSAAMPSMDRCPLPRGSLIRSRIGALAANRGSSGVMWPRHAISYTQGANDVAGLVTINEPDRVAVRLWPFTRSEHQVQLRVWRCNGRFRVSLAHDRDDDGEGEDTYWEEEMELTRGSYLDLNLPGAQGSILRIEPVETTPFSFDRPDPAISMETVELQYGDHLVMFVYNLGNQAVNDVLVRVTDDRTGKVLVNGEVHTGRLEPAKDFQPSFTIVEVKNITPSAYQSITIELDPEQTIDDLNPFNNKVQFRFRNTYTREHGWR